MVQMTLNRLQSLKELNPDFFYLKFGLSKNMLRGTGFNPQICFIVFDRIIIWICTEFFSVLSQEQKYLKYEIFSD